MFDCFSTSKFFVHKALMSFPNGSSEGLDGILPQILNNLTAKSNGQYGLNFLRALTNLVNVILEGKVPFELRPYFFGAKLIALKKPNRGLHPIAVGNTFRRLSTKCAAYHVSESRQARYGNRQVGVGTKRGAELASQVFRCLIENPSPKKRNFENWLWKRFQFDELAIHAGESFWITPWSLFWSIHTRRTVSQVFFFTVIQLSKFVKGPSKQILSLQFCFRIPFRIWLTVWSQK